MKRHAAVVVALGLLGYFGCRASDAAPGSHDDSFSKAGLIKANVADLKDTELIAQPDLPLTPEHNVLWCGTLQLAWNEAIDLVGEKLRFTQPSPIADLLNREDFTRGDLDPGSYVAVADFEGNHVEDEIRAALEKTFGGVASPELIPPAPRNPGPDDFVAYAYLYKNLAFTHPFADDQNLTFGDKAVASFGFNPESHLPDGTREQVSICDYQSPENFIVTLKTKSAGDQLILAKVPPGATLQATITGVLDRMKQQPGAPVGSGDIMSVPKLNFDLRRDFPELEGLVLQPSPAAKIRSKLVIAKAEQLVRFQLNEKGAILKSEAVIVMKTMAIMAGHHLVFDRPFLILMKQAKAGRPYFAMWVGNPSLLVPASAPGK